MNQQGPENTAPAPAPSDPKETFVLEAMEQYESALLGYAFTILRDKELAQDTVQDTFVRLCGQEPEAVREQLKAWLFTVCRNSAFDKLRKAKRVQPIDEIQWQKVAGTDAPPDEQLARAETHARILQLLDRLSDNQREVILLKFQQNLSYKEIAEITGLSEGNIGYLIHNGIKRVRELLPPDLHL